MTTDDILNSPEKKPEKEQSEFIDRTLLSWVDPKRVSTMKALLVGIYEKNEEKPICIEHLEELELLAKTFGIPVVGKHAMSLRGKTAATYVTTGKVEEMKKQVAAHGANIIIFDEEVSPAQQRNLEQEIGCPFMDRSEVILGVFALRAKSREARLQVELAQVKYLYPRLVRMWTHLSRQTGGGGGASGGGYLKGEGEKQIEIDRRILKRRIERLEKEIMQVRSNRDTKRSLREKNPIPVIAIVGYTNAGKSTLMNALTNADVYIEDKLFATLDTTTRRYKLASNKEALLIDTVGFIRKLPHLLVASFKSTLEEAIQADLLIHLIDSSHPMAFEQSKTTLEVIKELGASEKPMITVLNKVDKVQSSEAGPAQVAIMKKLKLAYPRSIEISAREKIGFDLLEEEITYQLQKNKKRLLLKIPQTNYALVTEAMKQGTIIKQEYEDNDVILELEIPAPLAYRYEEWQVLPKGHVKNQIEHS